ncbi:hypothetical protein ACFP1I_12195 [Dyadobacter subterraneus]|uniref:FecR protein domain-containing protein n=1 Tax=Dyadobacter subterraneus TaxID=2773304 RepID=A0ABR9WM48_9BACT|nr:hypothetical protein [Dyadobacter subterraneus]MBE9466603.1 hypothetical protein [Dyadobacter subterraneus]
MKITPELLEKYYRGLTNVSENHLIEQWLSNGEIDTQFDFPLGQDKNSIKTEMWKHITGFEKKGSAKSTIIFNWNHLYRIAACVVLLTGFLIVKQNTYFLSHTTTFDNSGSAVSKNVHYNNLDLTIASNSRCEVKVPYFGSESTISFHGAVSVKNRSQKTRSLRISMDQTGGSRKASELIRLKKGNTYLAMTDQTFKMVAATTQELEDGIPRPFNLRLTERFKLSI